MNDANDDLKRLARMIDVSAVRADSTRQEVVEIAEIAERFGCIAVFSLPCFIPMLVDRFGKVSPTGVGGVVGFPDGGETTAMKIAQTKDRIKNGCREVDMVMNVGFALSGMMEQVENDIRLVKQACGEVPLKVILECHYLTDDLIRRSCEMCVRAGADWVKTGTGWAPTGATLDNIALMKQAVGDRAKIKAAGGVRDLDTLLEMHRLGAERFGIGLRTIKSIFEEAEQRIKMEERLFTDCQHEAHNAN